MKKFMLFLCIFLASTVINLDVQAKDYSDSGEEYQNTWLEVYAGLGYYNWKLSYNTGLSSGTAFDNSTSRLS